MLRYGDSRNKSMRPSTLIDYKPSFAIQPSEPVKIGVEATFDVLGPSYGPARYAKPYPKVQYVDKTSSEYGKSLSEVQAKQRAARALEKGDTELDKDQNDALVELGVSNEEIKNMTSDEKIRSINAGKLKKSRRNNYSILNGTWISNAENDLLRSVNDPQEEWYIVKFVLNRLLADRYNFQGVSLEDMLVLLNNIRRQRNPNAQAPYNIQAPVIPGLRKIGPKSVQRVQKSIIDGQLNIDELRAAILASRGAGGYTPVQAPLQINQYVPMDMSGQLYGAPRTQLRSPAQLPLPLPRGGTGIFSPQPVTLPLVPMPGGPVSYTAAPQLYSNPPTPMGVYRGGY